MAFRSRRRATAALEKVIANPWRAALTVGSSILLLLYMIDGLAERWPAVSYMRLVVPFVPPFLVSRTARRVQQRMIEHDFIKDAEPHVFVAYPRSAAVEDLLAARPEMLSDSSAGHFGRSLDQLLELEVLPPAHLARPEERRTVAERLSADFGRDGLSGRLGDFPLELLDADGGRRPYILNSVLTRQRGRIKWQATLVRRPD